MIWNLCQLWVVKLVQDAGTADPQEEDGEQPKYPGVPASKVNLLKIHDLQM